MYIVHVAIFTHVHSVAIFDWGLNTHVHSVAIFDWGLNSGAIYMVSCFLVSEKQWSENRLGPFAKRDPRFPLHGNMGLVVEDQARPLPTKSLVDALLEVPSVESHKMEVMGCFLDSMAERDEYDQTKVLNLKLYLSFHYMQWCTWFLK